MCISHSPYHCESMPFELFSRLAAPPALQFEVAVAVASCCRCRGRGVVCRGQSGAQLVSFDRWPTAT